MAKLDKSKFKIVIDSREQKPYLFNGTDSEVKALDAGDYSVFNLERYIVVERKELSDIVSCMTSGRDRFERELLRLKAYNKRCIVIECNWSDIVNGNYRSKLNALAAQNTIISWMNQYNVTFHFAGDRANAEVFTEQFLYSSANNLYKIAQSFNFK